MRLKDYKIEKEIITLKSNIESTKIYIPFIKGALSVCKIQMKCYKEDSYGIRDLSKEPVVGLGTGFFIKFKDPQEENRYKYFLMTNEHVLQKEIIYEEQVNFSIKYYFEQYSRIFDFKKGERFIKEYKTKYGLDVTIVEIKPNEIPIILFLEPDYEINESNCRKIINKELIIHQYPRGLEQCISEGPIIEIEDNKIIEYKPSTQKGSSGSPLILKNRTNIIGIHLAGVKEHDINIGNFIFEIIKDVQTIKEVDYIYEEDKNRDKIIFTSSKPVISKSLDTRNYKKGSYEIYVKKHNEKVIYIKVTNIDTKVEFYDYVLYKNLDEKLDEFDYNIYLFEFNEVDNLLKIKVKNEIYLSLKKDDNEKNENYIIAKIEIKDEINRNKSVQIINSFEESNRLYKNNQYNMTETGILFNPNKSYSDIIDMIKKYENENEIKENCELIIDYKKVPFNYVWQFSSIGSHYIKYIFKKPLTKTNFLFYKCKFLTEIDLTNFDTKNVTNMENMFDGCNSLKKINLTNVNTRNTLSMYGMFGECSSLENIDFIFFNTEKVQNMQKMFFHCVSLKELDLSYFNTKNVTTMRSMFSGCSKIQSIDLSNFTASVLKDISYMFNECSSLTYLDVINLHANKITDKDYVFNSCSSIDVKNVRTKDRDIINALSSCLIF